MGITLASPKPATKGDSEEISSLRREVENLRYQLQEVELNNGSLSLQLKRANKVIQVLSDRSSWLDKILAHVAAEDGAIGKYN